jgi:hypothetical protein
MLTQAQATADRIKTGAATVESQVDHAFRLALGRPPRADELAKIAAFARNRSTAAACRLLFNSNEFLFID